MLIKMVNRYKDKQISGEEISHLRDKKHLKDKIL